jgi:hypothetical protein
MAGPLAVLPVGLGAPTTEVEDIDNGPLGGARAGDPKVGDVGGGPMGGADGRSGSGHHRS